MSQLTADLQREHQALDYFVSERRVPRLAPLATSVFVVVAGFIVLALGSEIFRHLRTSAHVIGNPLSISYYLLVAGSVAACVGVLYLARMLRRGSPAATILVLSVLSLAALACLMSLASIYYAHFDRKSLGGLVPLVSFVIYVTPIPLLVRVLRSRGAEGPMASEGRIELGKVFDESFLMAVLIGKLATAALPWMGKALAILMSRKTTLGVPETLTLQVRRFLLGDNLPLTLFALGLVVAAVTVLIIQLRGDRKGPAMYRIALRYAILYFGFLLLLELPLYLRLLKK